MNGKTAKNEDFKLKPLTFDAQTILI